MAIRGFNLADILNRVEAINKVEYRNPMATPYADPNRMTRSQSLAWQFLKAREENPLRLWNPYEKEFQTVPPIVGMIGAKGSGKTHFGSAFAFDRGQRYPESLGCVISNTYTQAKDNAGALIIKMAQTLDYPVEFFREKKINGRPYSQLFVVDLTGKGDFENGPNFYILVRSFEAVSKLEGIELDWLWCEEVQDAEYDAFRVAYSRVRGQNADRSVFIAGMPFDVTHWMYESLPSKLRVIEENTVRDFLGYETFQPRRYENWNEVPMETLDLASAESFSEAYEERWDKRVAGILFEPTIFENGKNLPSGEIARLRASLSPDEVERWIYGSRTTLSTDRVAYAYDDSIHRKGRMSRVLCHYDEYADLTLAIDFNTRPMCATIWQEKGWNDLWDSDDVVLERNEDGTFEIYYKGERIDSLTDIAPPDRKVGAQVDEIELWKGDTAGLMQRFLERYRNHKGAITILGDSTAQRDDTRSGTTDWEIIREAVRDLPNVTVLPGTVIKSNYKTGEVSFLNPSRRDSINALNAALKDGLGRAWICFLPETDLPSKGAFNSVLSAKKTPDGRVDDSNDRKEDVKLPRTHFFDTVRYYVWWLRGGQVVSTDIWNDVATRIQEEASLSESDWAVGRGFASGWNGVW